VPEKRDKEQTPGEADDSLLLREVVEKARDLDHIEKILLALRQSLEQRDLSFLSCGISLIQTPKQPQSVQNFILRGEEFYSEEIISNLLVEIWRAGTPNYRRDLDAEDVHGEREPLSTTYGQTVLSVLDVPFSHGTLAINSTQAHAFSSADIAFLEELAQILSTSFIHMEQSGVLMASALAKGYKTDGSVQARRLDGLGKYYGDELEDFVVLAHRATIELHKSAQFAATVNDIFTLLRHKGLNFATAAFFLVDRQSLQARHYTLDALGPGEQVALSEDMAEYVVWTTNKPHMWRDPIASEPLWYLSVPSAAGVMTGRPAPQREFHPAAATPGATLGQRPRCIAYPLSRSAHPGDGESAGIPTRLRFGDPLRRQLRPLRYRPRRGHAQYD
jgi:hypothetical protein